ncbi:Uncharacterised protein [uncultured archaeon]|nr:Uncharacterised protein [uncultured archaeon]
MFLFYLKEQSPPPLERKGEPPAQQPQEGFFTNPQGAGEKNSIPQELKKMIKTVGDKIKELKKARKEFADGTEAAKKIDELISALKDALVPLKECLKNPTQEEFQRLQSNYNFYLKKGEAYEKPNKSQLANYKVLKNPTKEFITEQARLYLEAHPEVKKTSAQLEKLFLAAHMEKLEGEAKRIAENTANPDKGAIRNHFLANPLSLYSETTDVSKLQFAPSEDGKTITFTNKQRQTIAYDEENRTITIKNPSFAEVLYGDILSGVINTTPLAEKVKNHQPITKDDLDFVAMTSILPALPFANLLLPKIELNHMFNEYMADGKISEDEARMLNDFRENMPDMYLLYGMLTLATVAPGALQTGSKLAANMRKASFTRDFIKGLYEKNYEIESNTVKKYGTEVPESKIRTLALENTKTDFVRVFTEPEFSDFRGMNQKDLFIPGKTKKMLNSTYEKLFSKRLEESAPYDKSMEIKNVKYEVVKEPKLQINNPDLTLKYMASKDPFLKSIGVFEEEGAWASYGVALDLKPVSNIQVRPGSILKHPFGSFWPYKISSSEYGTLYAKFDKDATLWLTKDKSLLKSVDNALKFSGSERWTRLGGLFGYPEESVQYFLTHDMAGVKYSEELRTLNLDTKPWHRISPFVPGVKDGRILGSGYLQDYYMNVKEKMDPELFSLLNTLADAKETLSKNLADPTSIISQKSSIRSQVYDQIRLNAEKKGKPNSIAYMRYVKSEIKRLQKSVDIANLAPEEAQKKLLDMGYKVDLPSIEPSPKSTEAPKWGNKPSFPPLNEMSDDARMVAVTSNPGFGYSDPAAELLLACKMDKNISAIVIATVREMGVEESITAANNPLTAATIGDCAKFLSTHRHDRPSKVAAFQIYEIKNSEDSQSFVHAYNDKVRPILEKYDLSLMNTAVELPESLANALRTNEEVKKSFGTLGTRQEAGKVKSDVLSKANEVNRLVSKNISEAEEFYLGIAESDEDRAALKDIFSSFRSANNRILNSAKQEANGVPSFASDTEKISGYSKIFENRISIQTPESKQLANDRILGYSIPAPDEISKVTSSANSFNDLTHALHRFTIENLPFFLPKEMVSVISAEGHGVDAFGVTSENFLNVLRGLEGTDGHVTGIQFRNTLVIQIRDLGHATSITITESPLGGFDVDYVIPKSFELSNVQGLPGFKRLISGRSDVSDGSFGVRKVEELAPKIRDFVDMLPTDDSYFDFRKGERVERQLPDFKSMPYVRQEAGYEKAYGHCYIIQKMENNQVIPIGGSSFESNPELAKHKVTCDFEALDKIQKDVGQLVKNFKTAADAHGQYLRENGIGVPVELDEVTVAINTVLKGYYEEVSIDGKVQTGKKLAYLEQNPYPKMSDLFENKLAQCAEIAALAQYILQSHGIESTYISGEVRWGKNGESQPHSFLAIKMGGKNYIYDPTNPVFSEGKIFGPSVYEINGDFAETVRQSKDKPVYFEARNVLNNKTAYFGVDELSLAQVEPPSDQNIVRLKK